MQLNDIRSPKGAKRERKRCGRGAASGLGKTCGRGHKGQKSRAGGSVRKGFEGGQMPLQRRLPKFGFTSRKSLFRRNLRISALEGCGETVITIDSLKKAGLIRKNIKYVKIYGEGSLTQAYTVRGIPVSKGAKAAIESGGGSVED
ncbi:50S ribosomal protein L15 [Thioalkalivibrio sp. HK1]|uniref:50S ribosomal protein L15 n=1 Tax=Thioalkalivibrio sp. HK1 TaxID=1469245 RepID=UPI00046FECEC|nr:50S ribosomal protein L15 [Thioalkalivibrio sp. HK1]